ncbi:MAG: SDR family oxidoreductase [Actinomycetota bacterium]|nr:SDR family oxidoreductase [Actinomycetota bacterium]
MRLLVLGGTLFLGRAVVEAALARGDRVTILTRGQTNPDLFPEAERLRGDRESDLSPLSGRAWDAVVDTSGYVPRVVRAAAETLTGRVEHYTFVSSISVYSDFSEGPGEDSPLEKLDDPANEDVQKHYGALKALCEDVVRDVYGERALVARAGLLVGPHDPTGRFTYWVTRVAEGGEVLAPGSPRRHVQFVDVRDLGEWILKMAESGRGGTFNATGPASPVAMRELLETCRRVSGSDARLVWVDDAFLLEHGVEQWQELPLWIASPELRGLVAADVSRAVGAGLAFRPLEETVRATLAWATSADAGEPSRKQGVQLPEAGLRREREAELIRAWREETGGRREHA